MVREADGAGHAVLTAVTDRGDLILDNQVDAILPWTDTAYAFEKRQSPHATGKWVWLRTDRPGATQVTSTMGYQTR